MKIVVTGASGGIGGALVKLAKTRGDFVIGVSRSKSEADVHYQCDVLDLNCLKKVAEDFHDVDGVALIHGHGGAETWKKKVAELDERDFLEVYRVDVVGGFNVVKTLLPSLKRDGSIVFVSSTPALVGDTWGIPYAAAKGALIALAKSLAKLLAPVRVNVVAFGPIETRWTGWMTPTELEEFHRRTVLYRLGRPWEAAEAIYWLLSDKSSYVTGHVLVVDGGESL